MVENDGNLHVLIRMEYFEIIYPLAACVLAEKPVNKYATKTQRR